MRQETLEGAAESDRSVDDRSMIQELEAAAEEAAAREATALANLAEARERMAALEGDLAGAQSAGETAAAEASQLREQLDAVRSQTRVAAAKYREARLAAAPGVPPELVPETDDLETIDRCMEAAERLVVQVRERIDEESQAAARSRWVPAGAPARKEPDLSSLSASEKIRIGLERLAEKDR
jgi:hypothetical protein